MRRSTTTVGIIGLCIGWLIPIAGIILGIISLAIKEKSLAIGILSIVISTLFWLTIWMPLMTQY